MYSLPKDKGSGPENASSNCRARTFRYFSWVSGLNAKMILYRTEYDNTSIKLRMRRILPNVRISFCILLFIHSIVTAHRAQASSQSTKLPRRASSRMPSLKQNTQYRPILPTPAPQPPPAHTSATNPGTKTRTTRSRRTSAFRQR